MDRPWRAWAPPRAILRQYRLRERLAAVLDARLRAYIKQRRSSTEEFEVLSHALRHGFVVHREGDETILLHRDERVGDLAIRLRRGTSDFAVYRQCLIESHYRVLAHLVRETPAPERPFTVLDAGANIRMSALFFARRIPGARICCVEPDPQASALCRQNLDANGLSSVSVLREAVWSAEADLWLRRDFRDGRSWSTAVARHPSRNGEEVKGVSIRSLLCRMDVDELDLLKLDVEEAEEEIFREPLSVDTWLPRVRRLAIEAHGQTACRLVYGSLIRHGFRVVPHGELLIAAKGHEERALLSAMEKTIRESFDGEV